MIGPVRFLCAILIAYIPDYGFGNFMELPANASVNYPYMADRSFYLFGLQQDMGLKLLNTALKESPHENIILSPHSVFHSFLILYFVINDLSRELTLRRFFDIPPTLEKEQLLKMYKIEHFSFTLTPIIPSKYVDVSVSSYLFVSEDIIFPLFVENHFRKNLIKANFSIDVNNSRKYINNYVAVSTYKHFKDLVPESLIKTNTGILVTAAGYFKGIWLFPFSPKYTTEQIFRLSPTENVTVPMMWQIGKFYTLNSNVFGFKIIELPYKNQFYSMIVMLPMPNKHAHVSSLLKLIKPRILPYLMTVSNWIMESVEVFLPKFKIVKRMDNLKKVAEKLGVDGSMYDFIVHQTGIDVDEGIDLTYDCNGGNVTARPTTDSTVTGQPTTDSTVTGQPTTDSTVTGQPTTDSTVTGQPTVASSSAADDSTSARQPTNDPTTTDSTTTDSTTTDSTTTDSMTTDSTTTDPTSTSQPMPATVTKVFRCDRPFVYAIINKMQGTVVVTGVYNTPEAPDNN